MVPGGCATVRQTIGDILSTANVVTPAAAQTKSLPRILGEPPPQTGPNEIASGAKSNQGTERQRKRQGDGEAQKWKGRRGGGFRGGKQKKERGKRGSEKERY